MIQRSMHLNCQEVHCGKIRLRLRAKGIAPIFAVGKTVVGRQRKIWNGSELLSLAAQPPPPPRLANPSSILDLHVDTDTPVWYSQGDAETFFDVLQVPEGLCPWFRQPPVSAGDLMQAGNFTMDFLASLTDDLRGSTLQEDDVLVPVSTVLKARPLRVCRLPGFRLSTQFPSTSPSCVWLPPMTPSS